MLCGAGRRESGRIACPNSLPVGFLGHIEVRAFLGQLFLKHLADLRVLVAVLDGVAAFFDVDVQTPRLFTRCALNPPRKAAQEGQHAQGLLRCPEVAVEPAGIARGGAPPPPPGFAPGAGARPPLRGPPGGGAAPAGPGEAAPPPWASGKGDLV